jgi:hypothetical protein
MGHIIYNKNMAYLVSDQFAASADFWERSSEFE